MTRPGAGYALLTVLLGLPALVLAGVLVLAVVRGPFYGLVDHGPYDDSRGGPGRAGAWLAHAAAAVPFAAASAALLCGLAALHSRMTAPLRGEPEPAGCSRRWRRAAWPVRCS